MSALNTLLSEYDRLVVAYATSLEGHVAPPIDVRRAAREELDNLLVVLATIQHIAEVHDGNGKLTDIARRAHAALSR